VASPLADVADNRSVIEELQQTQASLRESEERLQAIIQSAIDAILTVDEEQRIVMFNAAAEKMFGCPAQDTVGRSIETFIPQRFHAAHRGHIRRFSNTGVTNRALGPTNTDTLWAVRSNGTEFPIEASISQIEAGGKKLFTVILRDITERKRAEDALRESEERFRALVTASSDVVYRMSPDWSEMRQLGGKNFLADTEAPNRDWLQEYIHPDDQARVTAAINQAIRTRSIFELEHHVLRVDGSLGWTFSRAIPLRDANGEIVEWFGAASDVTERKRAEQRLRESEEHYRMLFDSIDEGFCTIEVLFNENNEPVDYRFLEANPAFETQTGIKNGRGKRMREIAPQHEEHWFQIYGKIALTGEPARFDNPAAQLQRWYDVHAFRVGEPQERKVAILFNDITERRRKEAALRESEERFQAMANGIPQLAWMAEADGHIVWYNQRWYEYTGTTFEQMEGWAWQSVHDPDELPKVLEKWKSSIATGQPFDMEFPLRGADGRYRMFLTRVRPVKDAEGRVVRWFGTNTDISERKEAEKRLAEQAEELSRKVDELARSNADLEQFAYVASHDLQEPLRMVTAYTQLLAERYRGKLDDQADKFIGYASEGALRMQVLIKDLLAFSRIGRNGAARGSVDCNAVVEEVVHTLASAIQESGAVVTHAALPTVWADRTQMAQVFQNLIGNAVKFRRKEPPLISVQAEKADQHWLFRVQDNGIGIAPEYAEKIFVVFQRLHARTEYAGNGIGLAICKKIIERGGGKIWVESQAGSGSTFKFTVPLHGPDEREGMRL
jgi:PAS domain S-box-containing protein